jgi:hypothetical protein
MTLEFSVIDSLLNKLPKDINKVIYSYYDSRCGDCGDEMKICVCCNHYFHIYHNCFRHKTDDCNICNESSCPFRKMKMKYCLCEEIIKCEKCLYMDLIDIETELAGITEYTSSSERDHTDLYQDLFRQGWNDIQTGLVDFILQ